MKRPLLILALLAAAAVGVVAFAWHSYGSAPLAMRSTPVRVTIERGMTATTIAQAMQRSGVDATGGRTVVVHADARIKAW